MKNFNQKAFIHAPLLLLLAAFGLITFLLFTFNSSFKNGLFSYLFPKPASHAVSEPISVPISPTPGPKQGDINGDNKVDVIDLSVLLSNWLGTDPSSDINKDGKVGIIDLSILLSNWGK